METTHEAAQKACEQSLQAFSLQETLSNPDKNCNPSAQIILSDINPLPLFSSALLEPNHRINPLRNEAPIKRHSSGIPIYTSIQSFLI